MGKIKKIKAERKRAEVERQLKKAQDIKLYSKSAVIIGFVVAVLAGGFYGYKLLDVKYSLSSKVASIIKKPSKETKKRRRKRVKKLQQSTRNENRY